MRVSEGVEKEFEKGVESACEKRGKAKKVQVV